MWARFRGDIFGGLTAAVVALPLALAFGVASGAGPMAGIYGAIVLGFFAAIFGGTPTQVSGPTGPMTVVTASVVAIFTKQFPEQGMALVFTTVMLGGLFQVLFGYLKLGRFINFIPYTVVSGFMTGIGLIIILLQIAPLLNAQMQPGTPVQVLMHLSDVIASADSRSLLFGLLLFALLVFWPRSLNRVIPSSLFVLIIGSLAVAYYAPISDLPTIGEIPRGLPQFIVPSFDILAYKAMFKYALVLALLGTIDSLLTSLVADSLTNTSHDSNKELIGQGIGNFFAGLLGGLPGAGATMRTVVNINSGGQTRLSGAIHSIALIILVSVAADWVSMIPNVVLAAILLKVGVDIIDWDFLLRLRRAPIRPISIVVIVTTLTVFVDLISAVFVGLVIASFYTLNRLTQDQLNNVIPEPGGAIKAANEEEQRVIDAVGDRLLIYRMQGAFSFGAAKGIAQKLSSLSNYDLLILDLSGVTSIDASTALAFESMVKSVRREGRKVILVVKQKSVYEMLYRLGVIEVIGEHKVVAHRREALAKAELLLISGTKDSVFD